MAATCLDGAIRSRVVKSSDGTMKCSGGAIRKTHHPTSTALDSWRHHETALPSSFCDGAIKH
eukprot:9058717-Lingulodinium_polyedra.AAC.1